MKEITPTLNNKVLTGPGPATLLKKETPTQVFFQ